MSVKILTENMYFRNFQQKSCNCSRGVKVKMRTFQLLIIFIIWIKEEVVEVSRRAFFMDNNLLKFNNFGDHL